MVDTEGAPVVGASVRIRHQGTGAQRTGATDDRGRFLIQLLQPGGPYTLTVESLGYAEEIREGLHLQVGELISLEVVLRQQAVAVEGIDVRVERADIFDRNRVGPVTLLDERVVESVPILSRDILDLTVLSPLVKVTDGGGFSVAGQNDRYNAILIDGILAKDVFGLTPGGVPGGQAGARLLPLDAVSQYEVLVAPFDVRLSGFTGGVMNAVTRSGTNDWRVRASAVHRSESLMGDLSLASGPVEASGVDRSLLALSVGGPLVPDRGHFFFSAEVEERHQPPAGYNLFRDDPSLIRIDPEVLDSFRQTWESGLGLPAGRAGLYSLEQTLGNAFARVDWHFPGGTRLIARNIFSRATHDEPPNRAGFGAYELGSNAVFRESTSNTTSLQVFSDVGRDGVNELELHVQHVRDETRPAVPGPQVEVDLQSTIDGRTFTRPIRVGGEFFAQQNDLEQTLVRVTDAISLTRGNVMTTFGVTGSYYDIGHTFLPGAEGEFYFATLDDVGRVAPERFQHTVLQEGVDPTVDIDVLEWGAFVQHRIGAADDESGFTMRFGLRVDVPHVLGGPTTNPEFLEVFGYDTSRLPSSNPLLSPRWGFNWQSGGERSTQVRGGIGVFSGQIPYVWLADAFHNDGLRSLTRVCRARHYESPPFRDNTVPPFEPGVLPSTCLRGPPYELRNVVVFDQDFRYPQDLKLSATVDREITESLSGSVGFLFNRALHQVGLRELNAQSGGGPPGPGLGGDARRYYHDITDTFDRAVLVTNGGDDLGMSLTAELRGSLTDRVRFQSGYTLSRAWDRMSLVYTDMISNFGLNPVEGNIQRPRLSRSNFDRPHKVVLSVFGAPIPALPRTEISVLYTGQSGAPFSYVYRFDANGDGYPGLGPSFDRFNDLLYAPVSGSELESSLGTTILMDAALAFDACLARYRGGIIPRNGCRAPWQNRLDLRLAHTVGIGGADIRLEGDLINVLNLIGSDLGLVEAIPPAVPLLDACTPQKAGCPAGDFIPFWGSAVLPTRTDEGQVRPAPPWNVLSPDSQWQMQFGARVTFGG